MTTTIYPKQQLRDATPTLYPRSIGIEGQIVGIQQPHRRLQANGVLPGKLELWRTASNTELADWRQNENDKHKSLLTPETLNRLVLTNNDQYTRATKPSKSNWITAAWINEQFAAPFFIGY